jgi:hypothetical protein
MEGKRGSARVYLILILILIVLIFLLPSFGVLNGGSENEPRITRINADYRFRSA